MERRSRSGAESASLKTLIVLTPGRKVTGIEVVCGVLLPMPLTAASAGGPPLTETKSERNLGGCPEAAMMYERGPVPSGGAYRLFLLVAGLLGLAHEDPVGGPRPHPQVPATVPGRP